MNRNNIIQYEINGNIKQFYTIDNNPVCPLIVGITGHRDINESDVNVVRARLRESLVSLCKTWTKKNNRSDIPILVLDGMASGADQLTAEVVLELQKEPKTRCLKLISVLPMPWEDYKEDFQEGTPLEKTILLRHECNAEIVLQLTEENRQIRTQNPSAPIDCNSQYIQLGDFLVRSSYFFFALWDGNDWNGTDSTLPLAGGTADVVQRAMTGYQSRIGYFPTTSSFLGNDWDVIQPFGKVFQIVSPRNNKQSASPAGTTGLCRMKDVLDSELAKVKNDSLANELHKIVFVPMTMDECLNRKEIQVCLDNMSRCNQDLSTIPLEEDKLQQSEQYILGDFQPEKEGNLSVLLQYYKRFDVLSGYFQNKFNRISCRYLWATFGFGLCFYAQSLLHMPEGYENLMATGWFSSYGLARLILDILYYFLLGYLVIAFFRHAKKRYYERYHCYRAVAEALRVQIFWYMGKISEGAMDNYHIHPIPDVDWVRMTLNTIQIPMNIKADTPSDHPDIHYIFEHWVKDQRNYFANNIKKFTALENKWNSRRNMLLYFAGLWVTIRIMSRPESWRYLTEGTDFLGIVLPCLVSVIAIAIAVTGIGAVCCYMVNHLRCYESQSDRYIKNLPIYMNFSDYIQTRIELGIDNPDVQKALFAFGRYALAENADWFLTKRKLSLPS